MLDIFNFKNHKFTFITIHNGFYATIILLENVAIFTALFFKGTTRHNNNFCE